MTPQSLLNMGSAPATNSHKKPANLHPISRPKSVGFAFAHFGLFIFCWKRRLERKSEIGEKRESHKIWSERDGGWHFLVAVRSTHPSCPPSLSRNLLSSDEFDENSVTMSEDMMVMSGTVRRLEGSIGAVVTPLYFFWTAPIDPPSNRPSLPTCPLYAHPSSC